jgi:hypothetical protein
MTSKKIFQLKEKVLREIPPGNLPWQVLGRLQLKTGIIWSAINEQTEVTDEQLNSVLKAVEEVLGKKIEV